MKKVLISMMFVFLFSLPTIVMAQSSLTIDCSDTNIAGQTLSCTLKSEIDDGLAYDKIEANINLDATNITFEWESGFSGNITDGKLTINNSNDANRSTIGKMNIKVPASTTGTKQVSITSIKLYKENTLVETLNNASDSVVIKSDIKTLESLVLNDCEGCKLSPNFDSNLTIYTVTTKTDTINIVAKASGNASVTGDGVKNLTKEKETFEIVVTSEAGNTKKYRITVTKEEPLSGDNSLKVLNLDSGKLDVEFSSDVTSYKATIDKEEVVINASANDSKATVTGAGKKALDYGKNEFTVIVTAENGDSKSYLITINRPDTRNANAYLKEITINGEKLNFEKDIVEYNYTVGNSVTELDIEAIPELDTSKVTIEGNNNLVVGKNEVTITVLAEDESEKLYKIIVIRDEIDRSDLFLEELNIEGYDIEFDKEKFEYNVLIGEEKSLNIDAVAENDDYSVEILGNSNLQDGSIIKIVITDEEGNSNIYKIKISVEENSEVGNNDNTTGDINYIPIIMTSLLVILLILDIMQIIKRVKKK